jgi:UDP-N-acetylglucosamine 1-carboxyvinyltransferase
MPARLLIEGGVPLRGEVAASAAKNAACPRLAAALLTARPLTLTNVPDLGDVRTMLTLLETHGATVDRVAARSRSPSIPWPATGRPYELVSTMRASVLVLGPLVARYGSARVALPGGCAIGVRPIDQHLKGLAKLGAEIAIENGYVVARASRLKAARIATDLVTVTGTENLMMAAALAEGTTIIENAAREPEVSDLGTLLTAMGARLHGVGTGRIEIEGVPELSGAVHKVVPDRIEASTLLVAAAITRGDVRVTDMVPDHVAAVLSKLEECGVALEIGPTWVRVRGGDRPRPTDIVTSRTRDSPPTCRRS